MPTLSEIQKIVSKIDVDNDLPRISDGILLDMKNNIEDLNTLFDTLDYQGIKNACMSGIMDYFRILNILAVDADREFLNYIKSSFK